MAAIHPPTRQQHPQSRLRSSSDPFTDPSPRSTRQSKGPPPPPPKNSRMPAAVQSSRNSSQNDIVDAVRDTVQYRSHQDPRTKVSRTQTSVPPAAVSSSRPAGKRSQSEDSANITEKSRAAAKSRSGKKGSQHADVIDRLDFTGVGPMFHHDGPFDACAPSRNKHRNKAPMYVWGQDDSPAPRYGDSAYPAPAAYKAFTNDYPEPPKKKVDAIAEAWGIHEPEPFEEFFAGGGSARQDGDTPASSIYNGKERNAPQSSSRRPKDSRDTREGRPHVAARRSLVPPPQPIFVADSDLDAPTGSPPQTSPGFPKRSKSIMQRFRKMRDAPNVPVSPDYEYDQQPPQSPPLPTELANGARPTHRSQNSFLGRLAGNDRRNQPQGEADKNEPFVFIDAHTNRDNNKDLPLPPPIAEDPSTSGEGYFEQGNNGVGSPGGGLGRKTSLMKKVGRVVRGTK